MTIACWVCRLIFFPYFHLCPPCCLLPTQFLMAVFQLQRLFFSAHLFFHLQCGLVEKKSCWVWVFVGSCSTTKLQFCCPRASHILSQILVLKVWLQLHRVQNVKWLVSSFFISPLWATSICVPSPKRKGSSSEQSYSGEGEPLPTISWGLYRNAPNADHMCFLHLPPALHTFFLLPTDHFVVTLCPCCDNLLWIQLTSASCKLHCGLLTESRPQFPQIFTSIQNQQNSRYIVPFFEVFYEHNNTKDSSYCEGLTVWRDKTNRTNKQTKTRSRTTWSELLKVAQRPSNKALNPSSLTYLPDKR